MKSYNLTHKQWSMGRRNIAVYKYLKANQRKRILQHFILWTFITISLVLAWQWCWSMAQADDMGWIWFTRPIGAGFLFALIFGLGGLWEKVSDYHKLNDELQKNLKGIVFGRFGY